MPRSILQAMSVSNYITDPTREGYNALNFSDLSEAFLIVGRISNLPVNSNRMVKLLSRGWIIGSPHGNIAQARHAVRLTE